MRADAIGGLLGEVALLAPAALLYLAFLQRSGALRFGAAGAGTTPDASG